MVLCENCKRRIEVEDGQEWQQQQHQEEQRVEASETVRERSGEVVGGGLMEVLKRKIGDLSRRIGGRILIRSRVCKEIRIAGEKDRKEEGEEVVKLEEVVGVSDMVELEVEEGVEVTEMEKEDTGSVRS